MIYLFTSKVEEKFINKVKQEKETVDAIIIAVPSKEILSPS